MIKALSESAIAHISTSVALQTLSSFVKELVENAIDAGSTLIVVTFYDSGR
jgi:DNA mismatch repair ATPase MutL